MSHRGDLTARMVELPLLLAERPYTQAELAQHFGVDRKTVKRAIDAVSLHYPVEEHSDGREARYCFSDGYKFTPPTLTPSELATLVLSQEAIAATHAPGSPFAEHARRLLMKVKNSLPPKLRDKLDALATVYGSAVVPAKDFTAHAATIDRLTDAAILRHKLRLTYHSLTDGKIKERVVEPYCVYFDPDGATLKLIGYDHTRCDITTFSVDRIRTLELKFTREEVKDGVTESEMFAVQQKFFNRVSRDLIIGLHEPENSPSINMVKCINELAFEQLGRFRLIDDESYREEFRFFVPRRNKDREMFEDLEKRVSELKQIYNSCYADARCALSLTSSA